MEGINRVTLLGHVAADVELRFTQGGQAVLNMRIATNESYLDKDKVRQERVDFHNTVVWGARAEGLAKFVAKGMLLLVEGSLRTSKFDKDGVTRYRTDIVASNVVVCGGKRDGGGSGAADDGGSRGDASGGRSSGQPPGGDAGDFEVKFGRDKGKKISHVEDLSWLRENLEKQIADPSKSRWHDTTRKQIASIDAEIKRRGGSGSGRGAPPADPPADDYEGGGGYGGAVNDADIPF